MAVDEVSGGNDGSFVLIVDDDAPIRNLVKQILKRMGHEGREARDGAEAIAIVDQALPRLMVLDLMMPTMNGWEVIEALRERNLMDRVPVIVLTAVGSGRTGDLPGLGVRAVLGKPFEIHELVATAQRVLDETKAG